MLPALPARPSATRGPALRPSRRTVLLGLGAAAALPAVQVAGSSAALADDVTISDLLLQVGADETSRNLAWFTSEDAAQTVQLALAEAMTDETFPTTYSSVTATTGATITDGEYYQHATLSGLAAETDYVYRVGSETAGWSEVYSFSTQAASSTFSFVFVGDPQIGSSHDNAGDGEGWATTIALAEASYPDTAFVLTSGDQVDTASNEEQYTYFLAPEQFTSIPLATALGNHDYSSTAYHEHFNVPNVSDTYGLAADATQSGGDAFFVWNDALFITLNTNNTDTDGHLAYVEATMNAHPDAAWTIVVFHHSVFSTASHAFDDYIVTLRDVLPAAFSELGVDLVLMGHDHHFTRSYLMNGTGISAAETAGSVSGTVVPEEGDVLYLTANSSSGSKFYADNSRIDECYWAAIDDQQEHPNFTYVTVSEDTITLTTVDTTTEAVVDQVVLAPVSEDDSDDTGSGGTGSGDTGSGDTGSAGRAETRTRLNLTRHRQVRGGTAARARVTVTAVGSDEVVRGRVKIFAGERLVRTATLKKGTAVVTLPKTLSVGTHELHAVYVRTDDYRRSVSSARTLRVRRAR
ncbi:FN3 domain-containing metallophosphoesterase family protein [Nocardioides sp. GY 10127]|uniref:FN3 domain-containing metallophosphoesterase family protein n=1 Tax=Nocardioides sp. GY 10127 TaxID=2569762 RepID=UPI0010A82A2D|nr:FN3 domain-containing metallophosphoesterase family protein [Nocardioides sp. GY 10127]TIC79924.1 metallophosphoesterase family protein [Nocardioides sp. GY 10127]